MIHIKINSWNIKLIAERVHGDSSLLKTSDSCCEKLSIQRLVLQTSIWMSLRMEKKFERMELIFAFTFYKRINPFCSLLEMNYISDFTQEKYVFLFYFVSWWPQQKIIFTVIIAILRNTQRIYLNILWEWYIFFTNIKLKHFRATRGDGIYRA